jgi:hypothetical protein
VPSLPLYHLDDVGRRVDRTSLRLVVSGVVGQDDDALRRGSLLAYPGDRLGDRLPGVDVVVSDVAAPAADRRDVL